MENITIAKGEFTNSIRGTISMTIFALFCIFDAVCIPLLFIPGIVGAVYLFYHAWFYYNANKQELIVYPKRIYVKLMQKTIEIPIEKISSIEKRGPYSLKIKSSSGTVKVDLCTNRDSIADEITKLMNKNSGPLVEDMAISLRMYQELLNEGIITQEEFDTKKKQLLGL